MQKQAQQEWGDLPEDRFNRRDLLVELFETCQGMSRDEAERAVDQWSGSPGPLAD